MMFLVYSFLFCFSFSQQPVDGVLAVVGSRVLLRSDVANQAHLTAKQKNIVPDKTPLAFQQLFDEILEENIERLIVLAVAEKDTNIVVGYNEINSALNERVEYFISSFGSKELLEQEMKMSVEAIKSEYWETIKEELLIDRFKYSLFSDITVTSEEVVVSYNKNRHSFDFLPAHYTYTLLEQGAEIDSLSLFSFLSFIETIRDSLVVGSLSFDLAAKRHSKDFGSSSLGGDLGFFERGSFFPEFERAAFLLDLNEISQPIKTRIGYHLIRLVERVGLKIRAQHIFFPSKDIKRDLSSAKKQLHKILFLCENDPGLFDSLVVVAVNNSLINKLPSKQTNSGVFYKKEEGSIGYEFILKSLRATKNNSYSGVFVHPDSSSAFVLYKYNETQKEPVVLEKLWSAFENLALNEKISKLFKAWIKEQYLNIYVEIIN